MHILCRVKNVGVFVFIIFFLVGDFLILCQKITQFSDMSSDVHRHPRAQGGYIGLIRTRVQNVHKLCTFFTRKISLHRPRFEKSGSAKNVQNCAHFFAHFFLGFDKRQVLGRKNAKKIFF